MIFGPHTKNKSISTTHTEPSQSISTLKSSHFWPAQKNRSIAIPALKPSQFDSCMKTKRLPARTTKKSSSTPSTKTSIWTPSHQVKFDPRHEKQVNFDPLLKSSQNDPQSNIKSISMPRRKNRVNFYPEIKKKSFSTGTQKPSQFRPLH